MQRTNDAEVLRAGALEVRPQDHVVRAGDRTVAMSVRELELLAALARQTGRVVAAGGAVLRGLGRGAPRR